MTDLVEILRTLTENLGWVFHYGRADFQNLQEAESENDPKWYFFLDPISSDDTNEQLIVSTGHFMILSKSDLDQDYDSTNEANPNDGKYRLNILPKKEYLKKEFKKVIECAGLELTKSRTTDVINFFDNNMDGVIVNFTITQYL